MNNILEILIKALGRGILFSIIALLAVLGIGLALEAWHTSAAFIGNLAQYLGIAEDLGILIGFVITTTGAIGFASVIVQKFNILEQYNHE